MKALIRLTLLLAGAALAAAAQDIVVEKDVAVPMRDGVVLRADVWRPAGPGPFPVLVYRTPYNRQPAQKNYSIFPKAVERGYAVVIQDVRGRYGSDGEYLPYQQEGRDGYDTIEWAARQPWSNSAVGTFGLSYPGAVQWLAAIERPPHLKAMAPMMTFATPNNFFYSGGVFDLSWIGWIWNNIAPNQRVRKNLPGPHNGEEARAEWERSREAMLNYLPLNELPQLKDVAPYYYEWMRHPPGEKWWDWAELGNKYDRTQAAVLNLSGWYDEAYGPDGALNNFNGLVAARKKQRDARTKVIMGPWVHGVGTIAETSAGERQLGPAAKRDYDELILRWMDHYLRGMDNGVEREKPVEVYVMGADRWRQAERWPLPETRFTPLYLSGSSQKKKSLSWEASKEKQASSAIVSDAAHPVLDPVPPYSGAHDYSVLEGRDDVLIFDSAPLEDDLEVTGPITAEIYLSCDAPDTDLWVRLLDVAPDGTAFNLMSPGLDVLRASYRNGGPRRELLQPGRVYKLRLTKLVTSNLFQKGHRLRVQISASFFPNFSRNLHSGELETVSAKTRAATLRIHHDRRRPSRLILPVLPK